MLYKSTRGNGEKIRASQAIISGIARDGGLFVPESIPSLDMDIKDLVGLNYRELAFIIMKKFLSDFTDEEIKYCIDNAYDSKFDIDSITCLEKKSGAYFLELFHGPTLAFKDMALSILPYLLTTSAKKNNIDKEIVILTATSGDTGKAALEGFSDVDGIKIIVFYPKDGVSPIQKRQMVTQKGSNAYVLGIDGNFDDAQNGVKEIFTDEEFKELLYNNDKVFSSANSINIGRLVPQIVYYFYAYTNLCSIGDIEVGDSMNVSVPTGNFGNILAAYIAKEMGLPIDKLICASNENKVLVDFFNKGVYDKERDFVVTTSPSMDILISSNLERLLYYICGEDSSVVSSLMSELKNNGSYSIDDNMKSKLDSFYSNCADMKDTENAIKEVYEDSGYLMDPHTAVGYHVYKDYSNNTKDNTPTVVASTASPYKFTKTVMNSIDEQYKSYDDFELMKYMNDIVNVPNSIKDIDKLEVLHNRTCSRNKMKEVVMDILDIK